MEALQNCDAIESDPHRIPILAQPPFLSKLVLHLPTTICTPAAAPQVFFSPESQAESFRPHAQPRSQPRSLCTIRQYNIAQLDTEPTT